MKGMKRVINYLIRNNNNKIKVNKINKLKEFIKLKYMIILTIIKNQIKLNKLNSKTKTRNSMKMNLILQLEYLILK